ncbi:DUF5953 family protein [Corallococcus sp. BB11-1]|uniref:DUF5953 family protein n=1 Tax=Corallococcus sp. BB11-1 TaxID=2996783 RepID=UPI0010EF387E|nr:DUF5953 family protein [Corallococcus sp. BB11-1]MCY1033430.1 DUF5953 family protein [Corallococcus sp. BB11-1]RYZ16381.1 MAG: hypothetical protein EOO70_04570 [Myxococcaceae bacterium]
MSPARRDEISLAVYAPALVGNDGRPLAIVRAMERASPGLRLEWKISDEGQPVPLTDRDAWVVQGRPNGPGFPLICNGGPEDDLVTLFGLEIPAGLGPGGRPIFDVHAHLPLNAGTIAVAEAVLEAIAEGARAFWGYATPFNTNVEISRQVRHPVRKPGVPPRGLPALSLSEFIRSPEIPHRLGWLNYWSSATASVIGFPDPARDLDLLSRARRTAMGGWVVRLTDEPLDLDNPAHLEVLLRTYERFPVIGGRAAP